MSVGKMLTSFPLLCLTLVHMSASHEGLPEGSSISDVLKAYKGSQIIVHIHQQRLNPNVSPLMRSNIVQAAVVFTLENGLPLQLFSIFAGKGPTFHVGRHMKNQIAWFVFMTAESKIMMNDVVTSYFMWAMATKRARRPVPHEHLLNLIIIHTTAEGIKMDFHVEAYLTPLYLVIFHARSLHSTSVSVPEAFDVCYDRQTCRLVALPRYFDLAQAGIQRVVQHVNKIRKDFKGDRLLIKVTERFQYSWEGWTQFMTVPWRFRKGRLLGPALLGEVLSTFAAMHNFTFNTLQHLPPTLQKGQGAILMSTALVYSATYIPMILSLSQFGYYSTLTSTDLVQPSANMLQSLAMPMSPTAICALAVAALFIGLILSAKSWNSDVSGGILLSLATLTSQVSSKNSARMTKLRSLYSPWMLLATFISIVYTNVIQSVVVVPEARLEDVSFDQMVQQNFSLFSSQVSFIRFSGFREQRSDGTTAKTQSMTQGTTAAFVKREKAIAEMVRPITNLKASTVVGMSKKEKRAVVDNNQNIHQMSNMLQALGRNVLHGIDRFFEMPHFWWFRAQKSFMLVHSLEWMKAAGLVEYFSKQIAVDKQKLYIIYAKASALREKSGTLTREDKSDGAAAGLSDSVVFESFVLLLYGTIFSLIAFTLEFVVRLVMTGWA